MLLLLLLLLLLPLLLPLLLLLSLDWACCWPREKGNIPPAMLKLGFRN